MAVVVTWDNEDHTLINMILTTRWQWSEIYSAKKQIVTMIASVDHKINVLVYGDIGNWLPTDFNENMFNLTRNIHPNVNQIIIIHRNVLFERLVSLFLRLSGGNPVEFVFVESMDDAQRYLTETVAA